jgi:hypothetical protein
MDSKLYTDIILPHPEVSSPFYCEHVENLTDALDEIIKSMLAKLSLSTGQGSAELQKDIDAIPRRFIDGKWRRSYRQRRRRAGNTNHS